MIPWSCSIDVSVMVIVFQQQDLPFGCNCDVKKYYWYARSCECVMHCASHKWVLISPGSPVWSVTFRDFNETVGQGFLILPWDVRGKFSDKLRWVHPHQPWPFLLLWASVGTSHNTDLPSVAWPVYPSSNRSDLRPVFCRDPRWFGFWAGVTNTRCTNCCTCLRVSMRIDCLWH